jgi:hypothetical protein
MQGYDLVKRIQKERDKHPNNIFIKTWRREEDWIDFDLVSKFLETIDMGQEFGGFSLIDEQEMWRTLEHRCGSRLSKTQRDGKWVLLYKPPKGVEIEEKLPPEIPYTPDSMLKILEIETQGNYVD